MSVAQIVEAELTWTGARFERGVRVAVGADGRIASIEAGAAAAPRGTVPSLALPRRAILPGFVNVHSHAFQRGLRGRGERFPAPGRHETGPRGGSSRAAGLPSPTDFWSWREAMFALVETLDATRLHAISLQAFREMRRAGITAVGEFHYVHHDRDSGGDALDEVIVQAAADAGVRLVLLHTYYRTGGVGAPLAGGQKRFATPSVAAYLARFDRLAQGLDPATQALGMVAHSIRAAPIEDIVLLHEESRRRGLVFHMHVEEQRKEIEDCRARYGVAPMRLFLDRLAIDDRFTAVHCTHTDPRDAAAYVAAGGRICICPLSEANLGDGIADVPAFRAAGASISVGTDSNARLCMLEELRWLELVQRLRTGSRGVIVDGEGAAARALLEIGTLSGARALGIDAGRITSGALADFAAIDLDATALAGVAEDDLLDAIIFGAGNGVIAATCVGGRWEDAG
jgi:formimidoylglutamate deiminase